jgi:hypothetical protein
MQTRNLSQSLLRVAFAVAVAAFITLSGSTNANAQGRDYRYDRNDDRGFYRGRDYHQERERRAQRHHESHEKEALREHQREERYSYGNSGELRDHQRAEREDLKQHNHEEKHDLKHHQRSERDGYRDGYYRDGDNRDGYYDENRRSRSSRRRY